MTDNGIQQCIDFGRHLKTTRHTRAECPALLPWESVAEPGSTDMSEEFQRLAELEENETDGTMPDYNPETNGLNLNEKQIAQQVLADALNATGSEGFSDLAFVFGDDPQSLILFVETAVLAGAEGAVQAIMARIEAVGL